MRISSGMWLMRNGNIAEVTSVPQFIETLTIAQHPLIYGTVEGEDQNWYIDGSFFVDTKDGMDLLEPHPYPVEVLSREELPPISALLKEAAKNPYEARISQSDADRDRRNSIALEAMKSMIERGWGANAKDLADQAYKMADEMLARGKVQ